MAKPLKPQRLADGTLSWKIQVSVRPFKRMTRAFPTLADAKAWRDATITELKEQRERLGADRAKENLAARDNLAALTIGDSRCALTTDGRESPRHRQSPPGRCLENVDVGDSE
jgi:hypothetical protein